MVFEDNGLGMEGKKAIIYSKRWCVNMNEKKALIKSGYYVELSYYDRKKGYLGSCRQSCCRGGKVT